MITYTSLMGLAAGLGMVLITLLGYKLFIKKEAIPTFDGWALSLGGLGGILTALGLHMTLTWPLQSPERYKNFMFGEPILLLGVLFLLAAFFLWRRGDLLRKAADSKYLTAVMAPMSLIIGGIGLALSALTLAAIQYQVFATAPPQEPILGTWPKPLVNGILTALYALPAIGCLVAPFAMRSRNRVLMTITGSAWMLAGIGWIIAAVVVYFTHIAMDFNFRA